MHNCSLYVSEAIESALLQDVEVEVIVVNECSSDNLDEVMLKYTDNEKVIYIKNRERCGVAKSRNTGVSVAKGDYVAFLDADDIWIPEKLSKQIIELERTGCVLCSTARELINPDGKLLKRIIPVENVITYDNLLKHNSINCSSVIIRTDVAREYPMHNDDCHEYYLMWLEVLAKYKKACGVNEPLIKYRVSSKGKSGSKFQSAKMTYMVYRKIGLGFVEAMVYFISYTLNGVRKYLSHK